MSFLQNRQEEILPDFSEIAHLPQTTALPFSLNPVDQFLKNEYEAMGCKQTNMFLAANQRAIEADIAQKDLPPKITAAWETAFYPQSARQVQYSIVIILFFIFFIVQGLDHLHVHPQRF
jgi:hypothetical protein